MSRKSNKAERTIPQVKDGIAKPSDKLRRLGKRSMQDSKVLYLDSRTADKIISAMLDKQRRQ